MHTRTQMQGRLASLVHAVNVSASAEQQADDLGVAVRGGAVQRAVAQQVGLVQTCSLQNAPHTPTPASMSFGEGKVGNGSDRVGEVGHGSGWGMGRGGAWVGVGHGSGRGGLRDNRPKGGAQNPAQRRRVKPGLELYAYVPGGP